MWGCQLPFAVYNFFLQGGAICYVVKATTTAPEALAAYADGPLIINAAAPGIWGNNLAAAIVNYPTLPGDDQSVAKPVFALNVYYQMPADSEALTTCDQMVAAYAAANGIKLITVDGVSSYLVESFPGFTAADLQKAATGNQACVLESRINGMSLFVRAVVAANEGTRPDNAPQTLLAGGAGDPTDSPLALADALVALDVIADISLLVVPETVSIPDLAKQRGALQQVIGYVEGRPRRDLFYIADAPLGLSVQDIECFKTGAASPDGDIEAGNALHSSYGALYYPWITFLNPANSQNVPIPLSGTMAGTYAAADQQVGPWQVAAGIRYGALGNATGVSAILTDSDQDVLNPQGINAIRQFVNYGIVAYGGRTLTTDPSLIYISVRRLLIEIEVSLYRGLQWVVFEPNTQRLWGSVTRDVTEFLTEMWQAGALFGATASEAFQVQCDAANNPPALQAQGQLIVDIKIRPAFPAEFVIVRIQQATLGSS